MIAVLQIIDALERKLEMKAKGIPVKGIDVKEGKIIIKPPRMSVSQKIRQSKSKKVRVSKRTKGAQKP